jgi:hypothetical protein
MKGLDALKEISVFSHVKDCLRLAVTVAKIDKEDSAVVASGVDPTAKRNRLPYVRATQIAACFSSKHRLFLLSFINFNSPALERIARKRRPSILEQKPRSTSAQALLFERRAGRSQRRRKGRRSLHALRSRSREILFWLGKTRVAASATWKMDLKF